MRGLKRSGKLIAVLLVLLTCLGFSPWAMSAEKAEAATDPTTLWNKSREWIASSHMFCDITKVDVAGVGVDSWQWTDSTTCDVILESSTAAEASFYLNISRGGTTSGGVKINGVNNTATSISREVELADGSASVSLQPYWSNKTGTLKTFNFSIEGGGQATLWDVTLNSGTGYTISPVGDSASPVSNKGSYTFQVDIADGYKKGANFAVKVNGTEVELNSSNQYTIPNIKANQEVVVEDVVSADTVNQYNITLTEANGVTYIPVDGSGSPVDEGGNFSFKVSLTTGFMASNSFAVNDNGTAMTPDANDVYTLSDISGHHTITVTGVTQLASVTAPTGSTVTAGYENGEWTYNWYEAAIIENKGDGTTVYWFNPITSGKPFYRVQHPDGVTYWNFESMAAGKSYTVTMDDLTKNGSFASDTIYHDFVYNYLDLGDVYLTVNERNYLSLAQSGTRAINVFRNWEAINSFTNDMIALPDVHYEVVDINGNPSDLVSVTTDKYNSGKATIKASGSDTGMAIIKVSYDAMIHMDGYASGYGAGGQDSTRLGAIWPECTGVIVVTVGQDGSSIDMGMTINTDGPMAHAGKVAGDRIDAEHDLLYYFGDEGAEYTFKPVSGSEVSIARCSVGSKDLSFDGFTTDGVTTDDDGNVTVTGLTAGRHIVKVEKGGVANYQVLSARHVTIVANDAEGNEIGDWQTRWFAPGDTIDFTLHNVNSPQEKLSQCYNNSFTVYYVGEDGKRLEHSMNGTGHGYGQYNFSSLDNTITLKIPDDWTGKKSFSAEHGAVAMTGFSGTAAGGHRSKTFGGASGGATGTSGNGVLAKLPDIKVNVDSKPYVIKGVANPVTKSVDAGETYALDLSKIFADDDNDDLTYKISIDGGDPVAADEAYEYVSNTPGVYELMFTANDGVYDSDDSYKVVLKVAQTNTPPNRKEGVDSTVNKTIGQDGKYELDLSTIFEDADEDFLSYKVSVDSGDYVEANKNYVYKPDSAGNVKLVFKANDGTVDSTDTFTVKLKVLEGVDPGIYWNSDKDGTGWIGRNASSCYVKTVSSSGVRTKEFEWMDDVTCDILLTSDTTEDAVFDFTVTNYASTNKRGVLINGNASAGSERTIQVQLENGEASVTVQPWGGTSSTSYLGVLKTFNFRIADEPANEAPVRKGGIDAEVDVEVGAGEAYSVDLSEIFSDPNNDDLTYKVLINGADPVAADENYSYNPDGPDHVTLVFKANDGKVDSTDTYTVNLSIAAHVHSMTKHDAIEETCVAAGNSEYYSCDGCGKFFSDDAGENEIDENSWVIAIDSDAHKWGEANYKWAADNSSVTATRVCEHNSAHKEIETAETSSEVKTPATCSSVGTSTYTASFENEAFSVEPKDVDDIPIDINAHKWGEFTEETPSTCIEKGQKVRVCEHNEEHKDYLDVDLLDHQLTKTDRVRATCLEDGNVDFWTCSGCSQFFSDEEGKTVIGADDVKIPAIGHKWGDWKVTKKATEHAEGEETRRCEHDDTHFETRTIDKLPPVKPTDTVKKVLVAKGIAKGKTKGKISWNNVKADRYIVYLSLCDHKGKTYKLKKVKTVSGKTHTWTKGKLKKNVWYKFKVVAQKKVNGKYKNIATSKPGHIVTGNVKGKYTNPKSLKLSKSKISLKAGKTTTIKGTVTKVKKKKALGTAHASKLRFISNNPKVATVNAKGKVTAKSKGTATIYVQTINGIWKTCKVTVK